MLRRAAAVTVVTAVIVVLLWPGRVDVGIRDETWSAGAAAGASIDTVWHVIAFAEVLANVLLFVPVGAAVAFASRHWWVGAVVGLVVSAACETAQTVIPARQASLVDVAANTVGAAVGGLAVLVLRRWMRKRGSSAQRL